MGGFEAALSLAGDAIRVAAGPAGLGVAGWFLAGVFVISGVAKLRHPGLAAMAIVDFGVARRVHPRLGWALGAGEMVVAGALVLLPRLGSALAAVLLWVFALLIGRSLSAGRRFPCFCFGDQASPLSRWTLARTSLLALLATGVLLIGAIPSPGPWAGGRPMEMVTAVALLGMIVVGGQIPRLLRLNSGATGS